MCASLCPVGMKLPCNHDAEQADVGTSRHGQQLDQAIQAIKLSSGTQTQLSSNMTTMAVKQDKTTCDVAGLARTLGGCNLHEALEAIQRSAVTLTQLTLNLSTMSVSQDINNRSIASLTANMGSSNLHFQELRKVASSSINNNMWITGQQHGREKIVGIRVVDYLVGRGAVLIHKMTGQYRKVPHHGVCKDCIEGVDGVEWDYIVCMNLDGAEYIFVLEAKMTNNSSSMLTMPQRLDRTRSWLKWCGDPANEPTKQQDKARFRVWSVYKDSIVRGVIAADSLQESVLEMAKAHNIIYVSLNSKVWVIVDPAFPTNDDGGAELDPVPDLAV